MKEAFLEAQNANCINGKVGAVIVINNKIIGKGNNSVPQNTTPCTD